MSEDVHKSIIYFFLVYTACCEIITMKQSNTQAVIHNSLLYQRYMRSSVKHNDIFSLSQLHVSTMFSHYQASHKRENKYTNTFGVDVSMLYINCVTLFFFLIYLFTMRLDIIV